MSDRSRLTPDERNDLVAYLDGELDEEHAHRIGDKIATSVSARREADVLQQSWELLDFLDMPRVSESFTHRTVEIVTGEQTRKQLEGHRRLQQFKAALSTAAVFAGSFAVFVGARYAVSLLPDRNRILVEYAPVIERLDEYRAVGDIEFLRNLATVKYLDNVDTALKNVAAPETESTIQPPGNQ